MSTHSLHGGRRRLLAAAAVVLAVAGLLTLVLGLRGGATAPLVQPPRTVAAPSEASTASRSSSSTAWTMTATAPTAVT